MLRFVFSLVTTCVVVIHASNAPAQTGRRFFVESDYQRLGLEQLWSSQVQLDSSRSETNSAVLQVVGIDSYEQLQSLAYRVYEVTHDGRSIRYSENDVDASGQRLGREEAQRLAEKQMILLEARGLKPELTTRDIPPTTLYVQSSTGTLHALDAETGKTLWAVTVGNPRWPTIAPAANDRFVATVNGSSLYLLDRESGEPIWDRPLGMNPTMSLAMSAEHVFVPGLSGQVEGYALPTATDDNHGSQPWVYQSGGRITAAPTVTSTTVSWATDRGQMFVASLSGPQMMYRRHTGGPIFGHATYLPPNQLVIASTDGYVSAINEQDGTLQWDFSTGFELYQTPISESDFTYAINRRSQMFCISSTDGTEQWMARGIEQLLACGKDRVYVRSANGRLLALDKKTGTPIGSLSAPAYRLAYSNGLTDRIYLMTHDGTVLCLREADAYYPAIYRPLPGPPEDKQKTAGPRQPTATAPSTPAVAPAGDAGLFGEDVFGGGADAEQEPAAEPDVEPAVEPDVSAPADESTEEPTGDEEFDDPFDFG